MPSFLARIEVWLKKGLVDAEGNTVKEALKDLGYRVLEARVGKVYELVVEAENREHAAKLVDEMCRRLLANPVKDHYVFELEDASA